MNKMDYQFRIRRHDLLKHKYELVCNLNLRVYVTGGGCSGFQYGFSFDKVIDEEDTCITKDGANLVVDSLRLQY